MFAVYALYYAECDDPEGRFFSPGVNPAQYKCWLNSDNEREVEYVLGVLRASYDRSLQLREGRTCEEAQPVLVRLWPDRPGIGPHGIVHTGCYFSRQRRSGEWREAENVEAADRDFPNHKLFWCSKCFGSANSRRLHRDDYR